jgi:hypothetical protein
MKTILKFTFIVCVALLGFSSCTKTGPPIVGTGYDLTLNYPAAASPGTPTTVNLSLAGQTNFPATITWFADDYSFPQSIRKSGIINSEEEAIYTFSFPHLPDGNYYYIRCSVVMPEGSNTDKTGNIIEKTVRILCMR